MKRILWIVAADETEFEKWCWKQDPNAPLPNVKLLRSVRQLRGTHQAEFLFLKGWQRRPDWRKVYNRALAIGKRES